MSTDTDTAQERRDVLKMQIQLADLVEVAVRGWQKLGGTPVSVYRVSPRQVQIGLGTPTGVQYIEITVSDKE